MNVNLNASIVAQDLDVDTLIQMGVRPQFAARGRYSWQQQHSRDIGSDGCRPAGKVIHTFRQAAE